MVFRYFDDTDMLYIELMPGVSSESQEIAPGVVVDFDANDRMIGIEVEDASLNTDLSELRVLALPAANFIVADRVSLKSVALPAGQTTLAESREAYRATGSARVANDLPRITFDPHVMGGKPCIRGMRVTVGAIVGLVAAGYSTDEILQAYPYLESDDIRAALSYAAWRVEEREYPLAAA